MFDIKWIRDNAAAFDQGLKNRGLEPLSAKLIEIDERRRAAIGQLEAAQARRNAASKDIGKAKASKDEATAAKLMAEVAELKEIIAKGEQEERDRNAELKAALEVIPNLPRDDVPVGADEKANKEVRKVGAPPKFDFAAEAALRDRRGAGPHGLRDGGENFRRAFRRVERRAVAPRARDCVLHARPAHGRVRLHRVQPAAAGEGPHRLRHRQPAEVRR